jgi:hypothetical protein
VFHKYVVKVVPPETVNVTVVPAQIVSEFTDMINVDAESTLTTETAEPVQPLSFTVTVYEVVVVGETVIGLVVSPELHEYVAEEPAPLAVNVANVPDVIVGELTSTVNDGLMLTVATALPEHSLEVPVTVYEVVLVGETEMEEEFSPVFHE